MLKHHGSDEYAINLLKSMVAIYSPTGRESELAVFLESEMEKLGYTVSRDRMDNVVGRLGWESPTILMCGHMDTVPSRLPIFLESDILHGRGTADAKAPLAAMIIAGVRLIDDGFKGSLIVAGTVQEEGGNKGIQALIEDGLRAEFAVFGEPTNLDTLTFAYKGCITLEIKVMTEPGHSSAPWVYKNSIEKAVEVYEKLKLIQKEWGKDSIGYHALTATIREISGGDKSGTLPSECKALLEFRIPPEIDAFKLKDEIIKNINSFLEENSDVLLDYRFIHILQPYVADTRNVLVKAFSRTIYRELGRRVALVKKSGSGDMGYYGRAFGVPTITYGPGDSRISHTNIENINIIDYLTSIEILKKSILELEKNSYFNNIKF